MLFHIKTSASSALSAAPSAVKNLTAEAAEENAEDAEKPPLTATSPVSSFDELDTALPVFFAPEGGAALLEIFTDSKTNAAFFEEYRKAIQIAFSH